MTEFGGGGAGTVVGNVDSTGGVVAGDVFTGTVVVGGGAATASGVASGEFGGEPDVEPIEDGTEVVVVL
jgi:hypothetical protein